MTKDGVLNSACDELSRVEVGMRKSEVDLRRAQPSRSRNAEVRSRPETSSTGSNSEIGSRKDTQG